ncbi:sulfurtransferase complex subunit TusC [Atopomonas sediminilitoris]|uniref:sulfurtransferase complex subunit TusC n=1 Tax=Atopomonas sediminilitoris TaxID=2919919 RepID=UPI001F4DF047|nr:sulfurtransferase complex subunit TusC [Atopomonas sediminilitoris]MCJ8170794.1 sulfurtransferase complex subunit TusC [Atopomonas sediminilitoris]
MSKAILLVSRHAPTDGSSARELLDIALAGGAFDLPISLLLLDDGVLQLAPHDFSLLQQKNLSANLQALALFGVEQIYAAERSLCERGLNTLNSTLPVQRLDDAAVSQLYRQHDVVITL